MEAKGADERFYTARNSARRSTGSEDERFVSPRESARSVSSSDDNEFVTPRESAGSASEHSARAPSSSSRGRNPADAKWDERPTNDHKSRDKISVGYGAVKAVRAAQHVGDAVPPAPDNDVFSAARHNRVDSVAYMLDQGVGVNARDEQGNTILLIACQNGLKRMAKLALRRGANINAQNVSTVLYAASRSRGGLCVASNECPPCTLVVSRQHGAALLLRVRLRRLAGRVPHHQGRRYDRHQPGRVRLLRRHRPAPLRAEISR